jgi:hypothetical protein
LGTNNFGGTKLNVNYNKQTRLNTTDPHVLPQLIKMNGTRYRRPLTSVTIAATPATIAHGVLASVEHVKDLRENEDGSETYYGTEDNSSQVQL